MNDSEKQDDDEIHHFCLRWAEWCRNMRFFAPPLPKDSIGRLLPNTRPYVELPDPELDANLNLFNKAVIAQPQDNSAEVFDIFYKKNIRPIKVAAKKAKTTERNFYRRLKKARDRAYASYINLKEKGFLY